MGFEPTSRCNREPDFESGAFDHSATSPVGCFGGSASRGRDSRRRFFAPTPCQIWQVRRRRGGSMIDARTCSGDGTGGCNGPRWRSSSRRGTRREMGRPSTASPRPTSSPTSNEAPSPRPAAVPPRLARKARTITRGRISDSRSTGCTVCTADRTDTRPQTHDFGQRNTAHFREG